MSQEPQLKKAKTEGESSKQFKVYRYPGKPTRSYDWKTVLQAYLDQSLEQLDKNDTVYYHDKNCIVIYDGYPKARFHLLLIPRLESPANSISELTKEQHLEQLTKCHATARQISEHLAQEYQATFSKDKFPGMRIGYHSIPSLDCLHLHIFSLDMDSPCLKNKKHWNSFTTSFLMLPEQVKMELEENGTVCGRCQGARRNTQAALGLLLVPTPATQPPQTKRTSPGMLTRGEATSRTTT